MEVYEREPTPDEMAEMNWWNGLFKPARAFWLDRAAEAGGSSPADAWLAFQRAQSRHQLDDADLMSAKLESRQWSGQVH